MDWKKCTAAVALISMPGTAIAQASCVTRAEAETVMTALSPDIVDGMRRTCEPHLSPTAALTMRGDAMAERYRPTAQSAETIAGPIVREILADDESASMGRQIDDRGALMLIRVGVGAAISGMLDEEGCGYADRFFRALEPLPARNFAMLLVNFLELGTSENPGSGSPLRLCPAMQG